MFGRSQPRASGDCASGGSSQADSPASVRRANSCSLLRAQAEAGAPGVPARQIARRGTVALGINHAELLRLHSAAQRQSARVLSRQQSIALCLLEGNYFELGRVGRRKAGRPARRTAGRPSSPFSSGSDDDDENGEEGEEAEPAGRSSPVRVRAPREPPPRAELDTASATAASAAPALGVRSLACLLVLCGCACEGPCNVLACRDRGCADLISLSEYLYAVAASAPAALRERHWRFPAHVHLGLALSSVGYTAFANAALGSRLPLPVLLTLKSGSLAANMAVGLLLLRRSYSGAQLGALAAVSAGLLLAALGGSAGGALAPGGAPPGASATGASAAFGICCLCCSLLSRALTGALQEWACGAYGRASVSEILLMRSLLALPFFAARMGAVGAHVARWRGAEVGGLVWPAAWLLLGANLVMDYACKALMTRLIGAAGALTATLALTVQKSCSFALALLLLSERTDPVRTSPALWLGSCAVLLGTAAFSAAAPPPPQMAALQAAPPPPRALAGILRRRVVRSAGKEED